MRLAGLPGRRHQNWSAIDRKLAGGWSGFHQRFIRRWSEVGRRLVGRWSEVGGRSEAGLAPVGVGKPVRSRTAARQPPPATK
eukprot:7521192-Lingulodinium_polyedra.AAC.1